MTTTKPPALTNFSFHPSTTIPLSLQTRVANLKSLLTSLPFHPEPLCPSKYRWPCHPYHPSIPSKLVRPDYNISLTTYRHPKHLGTRYLTRGLKDGHAANTCLTILTLTLIGPLGPKVYTFKVLRGSIPLLWRQVSSPKVYNPRIELEPSLEEQGGAFREWRKNEPRCTIVNLVDKKGGQGETGRGRGRRENRFCSV